MKYLSLICNDIYVKENPWTVAVTNLTKDNQYAFRAYADRKSVV